MESLILHSDIIRLDKTLFITDKRTFCTLIKQPFAEKTEGSVIFPDLWHMICMMTCNFTGSVSGDKHFNVIDIFK